MLFSICIPVRDDPQNLARCLAGFAGQNLTDCEIFVCDDGSRVPLTREQFSSAGVEFTLVRQVGQGPSVARNHLARMATGQFLFFVDADTVPRARLVENAKRIVAENPQIDAFYGSYDDEPFHKTLISSYRNLLHHFTHHQSAKGGESVSTFWCGCGVIRRDLYLDFGGLSEFYDKPSIEDIELGTRISARGHKVKIYPDLQVKHLKKWTLRNWLHTDLFRRGIPWVRLMRATNDWASQLNFSWAQRMASLGAVVFVLSLPLILLRIEFALVSLVSLAAFLAPNLPFIDLVRRKRGIVSAIAVIPLHLMYALICVASVGAAFLYPPLKLPSSSRLAPLPRR
jgi:glycosyltransferase involved in cell wall biosynthesis